MSGSPGYRVCLTSVYGCFDSARIFDHDAQKPSYFKKYHAPSKCWFCIRIVFCEVGKWAWQWSTSLNSMYGWYWTIGKRFTSIDDHPPSQSALKSIKYHEVPKYRDFTTIGNISLTAMASQIIAMQNLVWWWRLFLSENLSLRPPLSWILKNIT